MIEFYIVSTIKPFVLMVLLYQNAAVVVSVPFFDVLDNFCFLPVLTSK